MKSKILLALGAAAMVAVTAQTAGATENRDPHKLTRHHVSRSAAVSDARARAAYDEWRPAAPRAALDEAARYRNTSPMPAGH
ncbi:hypothetical protein [Bradyrhizobium prioriisuperbiae]|uniref:hypothetical protein n=1 Tax=Bradyrhizobium prioriisuperbiae TaxID=2854389 RepID=UPI0028E52977|nr:hypothetical protein [Bradyrhizobium prioritasuperba]